MADKEKKKPTRIISSKFSAMYAWLSTPNTKHDKDGAYQVSGKFDPKVKEDRAFLSALKKLHTESVAEARKTFKPKKKGEEMKVQPCMYEEDDGTFRVNFKESAFIEFDDKANPGTKKRIDLKPLCVDAIGRPISEEVWSGSTIKVAIDVAKFYNGSLGAGLSLRLKGVQVLELRTRGSRDGASLGFGVESGYGADSEESAFNTEKSDQADDFLSDDEEFGAETGESAPADESQAATSGDDFDF